MNTGKQHFWLPIYVIYSLKFTLYLGTHNIRTCTGVWCTVSAASYSDAVVLMQGFSIDHQINTPVRDSSLELNAIGRVCVRVYLIYYILYIHTCIYSA